MRNTLTLLALCALTLCAEAQSAPSATLTWTGPTTYSDGSPIDPTTLTYNVYQGLQGQTKVKAQTVSALTATLSTGMIAGRTYCWAVTAVANSLESAPSGEACKTFPAVAPSAPTGLTVK